jgi:hypothetical protein
MKEQTTTIRTGYDEPVEFGGIRGRALPPISDEDLKQLERGWNDPKFYQLSLNEAVVTAGYVPKPSVDPNARLIPTHEQIAELPRWARAAFAVRCARRVLPLAPEDHQRACCEVVEYAERLCSGRAEDVLNDVAMQVWRSTIDIEQTHALSSHCSNSAIWSVQYAVQGDPKYAIKSAREAAMYALLTLGEIVTSRTLRQLLEPARDFEQLNRLAKLEKWTDETPVPQSVFGPMWEGTPPEWWSEDAFAPQQSDQVNLKRVGETQPDEVRHAV